MAHRSHQLQADEGKRIKTETAGAIGDTPIRLRRIILMPANGRPTRASVRTRAEGRDALRNLAAGSRL
jgi:hypothetical protein